jgi:hypothetical protein
LNQSNLLLRTGGRIGEATGWRTKDEIESRFGFVSGFHALVVGPSRVGPAFQFSGQRDGVLVRANARLRSWRARNDNGEKTDKTEMHDCLIQRSNEPDDSFASLSPSI